LFSKLDKLVLRTFVGPFIATFFIALFAIVIQHFWKYIDEMVGKGIDFFTLLKIIGIVCLSLGVMFALPIAVLLASIMAFGNLAESFELVAIKSSGISLLRFMRPIFIFVIFICGVSFMFNNYVLPWANLKFFTMLSDIRFSKPGFDITPGAFYTDIPGYAIYTDEKNDKTGSLNNVVIYETSNSSYQDNFIVADSGTMRVTPDKRFLEFTLYNGERSQEKGSSMDANTEFIRIQFKEFKKSFDISSLLLKETNDSANKGFYKALNLSQLNKNIDSLKKNNIAFANKSKTGLAGSFMFINQFKDSSWKDSSFTLPANVKKISDLLPDSVKGKMTNEIAEKFNGAKNMLEMDMNDYRAKTDSLRYHKIEWHRKFTFSIIALVMFLIGAPLGAIIRRGGLGTPLLLAIVFFVVYFVLFTLGEKSANTDTMTPVVGMWLPVYAMLPVGLFLLYKARKDANLFSQESIYKLTKSIKKWFTKRKSKKEVQAIG
jgi:lipopolysaccharide export system permease protein